MRHAALVVALLLAACGSQPDGSAPDGDDSRARDATATGRTMGQATGQATGTPDAGASASPAARDAPRRQGRYAPRDECGKVAGAAEFRRKLADAAIRNDAAAIGALTAPDVRLGFGGDDGRERMLQRLRDPGDGLIGEIRRLLPLGCGRNVAGDLTMPWIFAQDLGDIDGYTAHLVVGENVPLHAAADGKSAVKQRISWDLVELDDGPYPDGDLLPVTAPDGTRGFMRKAMLRSLLGYRLIASRESGAWKITAILAGD